MSRIFTDFFMGIPGADGITAQSPLVNFDGTQTISANKNSVPVWSQEKDGFGIQVSCPATGVPSGTVAFQASNDKSMKEGPGGLPDVNLVNWSTVSFWDEATAAWAQSKTISGASSFMFSMPVFTGRWLRFVWTNTSGSALLTVKVQCKSDGGR